MGLITSISDKELSRLICNQCNHFFPDGFLIDSNEIYSYIVSVLGKIEHCFSNMSLPYFKKDGMPFFNHLHGDHYCIFLCYLSNVVFQNNCDPRIASKFFLLNKALHGLDAFYEIIYPDIFLVVHPIGTILGRAKYADKFVVYQGVTVGATTHGIYPSFSEKTILYSNSSIIGDCRVGTNFILGAKSSLINCNIESNKLVVGNYPSHRILGNHNDLINKYFLP